MWKRVKGRPGKEEARAAKKKLDGRIEEMVATLDTVAENQKRERQFEKLATLAGLDTYGRRTQEPVTTEEIERALKMVNNGTAKQIGKQLGVPVTVDMDVETFRYTRNITYGTEVRIDGKAKVENTNIELDVSRFYIEGLPWLGGTQASFKKPGLFSRRVQVRDASDLKKIVEKHG